MSDLLRSAGRREAYILAVVGGIFVIVAAFIQGPGTEWFKNHSANSVPVQQEPPSHVGNSEAESSSATALEEQSASVSVQATPPASPSVESITADPELSTSAPTPTLPQNCATNTSFQCAAVLGIGSRDSDNFGGKDRYYSFVIRTPGQVRFTLNPMPTHRFVSITITDSEYQQVEWKSFRAGQPGSFLVNLRQPGRYYAKLYIGPCCGGGTEDYTFALSRP